MDYNRLLEGKVAVITSGAHGMGKAIAKLFCEHGATCIVNGRDESGIETEKYLQTISEKSKFIKCDMSKKDEVDNFISKTLEYTNDKIDIVVNNVGVNIVEYIVQLNNENFEYVQQVNLRGTIRTTRGFLPAMMKSGGSFLHISTIQSLGAIYRATSYATSKSAINAFSVGIAADYGEYGIRSNVITPGGVYTTGGEKLFNEIKDNDKELLRVGLSGETSNPDYGPGSAKDIANASLYLVSDLGRYITGALIVQDGGATYQSHYMREKRLPSDYEEQWIKFMKDRY